MLLTALLGASLAAEPVLTTALAVAGWESGLQLRNQGGVKHTLYADPESTLLGDVYVRGDVLLTATPDYLRGGLQLEFSPMAMLVFRLRSETTCFKRLRSEALEILREMPPPWLLLGISTV